MRVSDWLKYLFGHRTAILEVAKWRGGIWASVMLVVLTGIARNYDQTFITEKPLMWLFGSLLFSFVSGGWLYIVLYGFSTRGMADADGRKPPFWSRWRTFMGLFWMTAPIAWLYAIPVERYFDSLTAAKLNITLLAVVSLWRVLLMARVMQVITTARFTMALVWVLFAAALEVCVVFFLGDGFARRIMASMGGMRNSPEEEILYTAMSNTFSIALWTVPIALIVALLWRERRMLTGFPEQKSGPMPWWTLVVLTGCWVGIAIVPQCELAKSVAVEQLISEGRSRAVLDYFANHQPADFAPARTLPPKPYEREFFEELPACFGVIQPTDPEWVRVHLMHRLDQMLLHSEPHSGRKQGQASYSRAEQIKHIAQGLGWHGPDARGLLKLLDGLARIPEGNGWLQTNAIFLEGVREAAREMPSPYRREAKSEEQQLTDWLTLSNRLQFLAPTNLTLDIAPLK